MKRSALILFFAGAVCQAKPAIMLDDFLVGGHHDSIATTGRIFKEEFGLDTDHVAFGGRKSDLAVPTNDFGVPVNFDLGGGVATVSVPSGQQSDLVSLFSLQYWSTTNDLIDFSQLPEFQIDFSVAGPADRRIDHWSVTFTDAAHRQLYATRPAIVRGTASFFRSQFVGSGDWSSIRQIDMGMIMNGSGPPHPGSYSLTRFEAVPEPSLAFLLLAALRLVRRRK